MKKICLLVLLFLGTIHTTFAFENANREMMVRISEIEVYPNFLNKYIEFDQDVATLSVNQEDGVISFYPMMVIIHNNLIRII